MNTTDQPPASGSAREVFLAFLKLGLTSFGGPIAHLGYFRAELVERRRWISESQFSQLLAVCQFLPGPASSQLGFTLGLLRGGWLGGLAAFLAFTLPSALLLFGFALIAPLLRGGIGEAVVHGLKLVALAVVASAVLSMSKKLCPDRPRQLIAIVAAAVVLSAGTAWIQLLVVAGGGLIGLRACRSLQPDPGASFTTGYGMRTSGVLLGIFGLLLVGLPLFATAAPTLTAVAEAFYRAGALVFGGGHVVLPLLEDTVVGPGWVSQEQFLAGYGAAQAIPGPMFAFSAFLGAEIPTGMPAIVPALTALAFMFLPGFLLVAAVLPAWSTIARNASMARAIAGINAAVVGLLGAALYDPILTSSVGNGIDLAIGLTGFALLALLGRSPLLVVLWCVGASIAARLV
ncbi:chromate efflux transporter [uncultured Abyssibacter sp.]|uniref:chromate efflux transporter n=1 Tax=uncultured Abyssibacter sp. TaxID=2320202 RepID=UPI0032B180ED